MTCEIKMNLLIASFITLTHTRKKTVYLLRTMLNKLNTTNIYSALEFSDKNICVSFLFFCLSIYHFSYYIPTKREAKIKIFFLTQTKFFLCFFLFHFFRAIVRDIQKNCLDDLLYFFIMFFFVSQFFLLEGHVLYVLVIEETY